jgi:hypothetical protein
VEVLDDVLEGVAADEAHGVEGAAVGVGAQAVDGDDAGVLQAAGHLGFEQKPRPAVGVVGVAALDLLEGDLAVELAVVGHKHFAEAAAGVRPQDLKAQSLPGAAAQRGPGFGGSHAGCRGGQWRVRLDVAGHGAPGRCHQRLEQVVMAGEALLVFGETDGLARLPAVMDFQRQQLAQQGGPHGALGIAQEVL